MFLDTRNSGPYVVTDNCEFIRRSLDVFRDHGVRRVGLISSHVPLPDEHTIGLGNQNYCPVAATFVEISVHRLALALVDLLDRQFRGEKVQSVTVPFTVNHAAECGGLPR
ncbi:MAG: hypothetical protein K9N51_14110 [Candidatus Pacebacteria bacterium]|nr:hypothetical protein [Candidatus Paceibacterota bacterium]